jgi:hypothetical protein
MKIDQINMSQFSQHRKDNIIKDINVEYSKLIRDAQSLSDNPSSSLVTKEERIA